MSDAGADATKLARALLGRALAAVRAGGLVTDVDAAVGLFVAAPAPASYLGAVRALASVARSGSTRRLDEALGANTLAARVEALPPSLADDAALLAALPPTLGSASRLHALARLLETHDELARRVRAADARLGAPQQPRAAYAAAKPGTSARRRAAPGKRR